MRIANCAAAAAQQNRTASIKELYGWMVTPPACLRQQWSYVPAGVYDFPLGQEQISQLYSAVPVRDATPANEVKVLVSILTLPHLGVHAHVRYTQ
jgi:hypothetical protein